MKSYTVWFGQHGFVISREGKRDWSLSEIIGQEELNSEGIKTLRYRPIDECFVSAAEAEQSARALAKRAKKVLDKDIEWLEKEGE